MTVVYDEEHCVVEVEFEDGYSMNVDIIPTAQNRFQFLHVASGDGEVRRNYRSRIHATGFNIQEGK